MKKLTPRELQVVKLACAGFCNKEIGVALGCTTKTVDHHRYEASQKMGVCHPIAMLRRAIQYGIVDCPCKDWGINAELGDDGGNLPPWHTGTSCP